MSSDFDFDCKPFGSVGRCVLVGKFWHDDSNANNQLMRSIRFDVDTQAAGAQILDAAWATGPRETNGVIGVSLNPLNLFVSASVPVLSSTSTTNTRTMKYAGESVASTEVTVSGHRGDAEGCEAVSGSVGAATMHGGYSISWCPGCGGTQGTLEGVSWGRKANGTNRCF